MHYFKTHNQGDTLSRVTNDISDEKPLDICQKCGQKQLLTIARAMVEDA